MNETERFSRIWAAGLLVLMSVTWRLWWPAMGDYPVVPLKVNLSQSFASVAASAVSVVTMLALLGVVIAPFRTASRCWWIIAASLGIGFVLDQHRLQPWAYQSAIYAVVFASMDRTSARRWLMPLVASVYVFSALGKFDYQFMHTVGQEFLGTLLSPVGGFPATWDEATRAKVCLVMPTGELLVGVGLLLPWTRRIAGVAAVGLHITLIAILGPWALGHSLGVLCWNVLLIAQAWLLFVGRQQGVVDAVPAVRRMQQDARTSKNRSSLRLRPRLIAQAVVSIALVMPLFERAGYWDHWLSWSLYSPHTSRVDVELFEGEIAKLPASIQDQVSEGEDAGWKPLSLSQWSLRSRSVPVYPQARYQLGLVRRLCEQHGIDSGVRVYAKGVSERWTGRRDEAWLKGVSNLGK